MGWGRDVSCVRRTADAMDLADRLWPGLKGFRSTFAPPDAEPHVTGRNGQDTQGRPKLSTGRLCTSRAMIGTGRGWDGTREETAIRL